MSDNLLSLEFAALTILVVKEILECGLKVKEYELGHKNFLETGIFGMACSPL
jgi:hypothetical protein